ncbi:MAG: helix-turn-helix transcriptional regulator [Candidatus Micrarchaeia archaeon]
MNRQVLLLIFAMCLAHASMIYTVDVDRAGFAEITLSIEGGESAEVALPGDAAKFRIVGGTYYMENDTAGITPGKLGFATFSFSSSMLTEKEDGGWKLRVLPPEGAKTRVYMPPYTTIGEFSPRPELVSSTNSRTSVEMAEGSGLIEISYLLEEQPLPQEEKEFTLAYIVAILVLLIITREAAIRFWIQGKNKASGEKEEKRPTLELTPGKKEMMETFNENDLKIVKYLLENEGKSRRNLLERKAGISKSSLSMAIRRLERRKIIEIDRSATTHFVKLSEYFLRL